MKQKNTSINTSTTTQSLYLQIIQPIVALSGYLHDIGKTTVGFQEKLNLSVKGQYSARGDTLRHDLTSFLFLTAIETDEQLLTLLSSKAAVSHFFNHTMMEYIDQLSPVVIRNVGQKMIDLKNEQSQGSPLSLTVHVDVYLGKKRLGKHPLLSALMWLVLTHHRNCDHEFNKDRNIFNIAYDNFMNLDNEVDDIQKFITVDDSKRLPWHCDQWLDKVSETGSVLRKIVEDNPEEISKLTLDYPKQCAFITLTTVLARFALVMSDHYASIDSSIKSFDPDAVYANTRQEEGVFNKHAPYYFADTLEEHLMKVGDLIKTFFHHQIANKKHLNNALSLLKKDLPRALTDTSIDGVPERFLWQKYAAQAIESHKASHPDLSELPSFMVIISRTGSGKTRTAISLLAMQCEIFRVTLALSMRTLTLQSFESYLNDIGFRLNEVSILLGQMLKHEEPTIHGSDAIDDFEKTDYLFKENPDDVADVLMSQKRKTQSLINTPVSVMTVDHIAPVTYKEKGSDFLMMHHVLNSDLILDEVDDYNEKDFIVLSKLVFEYGLAGRKVVICSATLTPTQISVLEKSFMDGVRDREAIFGQRIPVDTFVVNDLSPYITINRIHTDQPNDFMNHYDAFVKKVSLSLHKIDKKHKVKHVKLPKKREDLFETLTNACLDLHDKNGIVSKQGQPFSIGFARFNNVETAQSFADYLLGYQDDRYVIKTVCYHSKMLGFDRYLQEQAMNRMLTRKFKEGETDPIFDDTFIQSALSDLEEGQELVVIVSTTSIQETGRDHDYDWCLLEPSSERSLVQSVGRVWRHREKSLEGMCYNVGVLEAPVKTLDDTLRNDANFIFGFPGIESVGVRGKFDLFTPMIVKAPYTMTDSPTDENRLWLDKLGIYYHEGTRKRLVSAKDAFHGHYFSVGVDAENCLNTPKTFMSQRITCLQTIVIAKTYLNEDILEFSTSDLDKYDILQTTNAYTQRSDLKMTGAHGQYNHLRSNDRETLVLIATPLSNSTCYAQWWENDSQSGHVLIKPVEKVCTQNMLFASIINQSSDEKVQRFMNEHYYDEKEKRIMLSLTVHVTAEELSEGKYHYHPFFGLLKGKTLMN